MDRIAHAQRNHRAGIAAPFHDIPPLGTPLQTWTFQEIMAPLLEQLSSLAYTASVVLPQDAASLAVPILDPLWQYAEAADTVYQRWGQAQRQAQEARQAEREAVQAHRRAQPLPADLDAALEDIRTILAPAT